MDDSKWKILITSKVANSCQTQQPQSNIDNFMFLMKQNSDYGFFHSWDVRNKVPNESMKEIDVIFSISMNKVRWQKMWENSIKILDHFY